MSESPAYKEVAMERKALLLIMLLILALLILTGCSKTEITFNTNINDDLQLAIINNRPAKGNVFDVDTNNLFYEFTNNDDELTDEELERILDFKSDHSLPISMENFLEDVDYLFRVLKYGYSGTCHLVVMKYSQMPRVK